MHRGSDFQVMDLDIIIVIITPSAIKDGSP